mmetsp:Transcript_18354/g.8551  ORF Transcript_18354/g.8551 Transcript_18354/m.8551 type:complete len:133 (-) Transcript_18354:1182-1580(-)
MNIQQHIVKFVTWSNWVLLVVSTFFSFVFWSNGFARGIFFGGLIVTINFHLLYKTLKKAFTPPNLSRYSSVLAKYYIRFILSGIIIFILLSKHYVSPIGLILGLSIVVVSIIFATIFVIIRELKKNIFKEAI